MKRIISIILSLAMLICIVPMSAMASDFYSYNAKQQVANVYGIPMDVLATLDEDILSRLVDDAADADVISSNDTYIKISYTEDGESIITDSTLLEYQRAALLRDTDENDWMRIHTTIIDRGNYAQVSAAYTWLTRPSFRMTDVIGLSITQGTFIDKSADGFYTYTTSQGSFDTDFSKTPAKFDYQGHGIVRNVTLAKPDYPVNSDFLFMKGNIHKESGSEGLNGTYGHQRVSVALVPSFNIDRNGWLSCVGINIGMTYDQFSGYTDIAW